MDSVLLEYFLRVTELGSISKAALDLQLSQPALSRHVAALEHEMGQQLLVRGQGGVSLTDAGRLLADRARPLLRQFAILKEQVGEKAAGQVSIGIPQSWQQIFTLPFVSTMVSRHPAVALRVFEGVSHVLREHLLAGLLDLCVIPFDGALATGFEQTPLVREPLVLVAHRREDLQPDQPVPVSMLNGMKLVLPGRANALRTQVEQMLSRRGLDFRIMVETDTLALCLDLAQQGIGATVVPACSLYGRAMDGQLSWAPIRGLYMSWALCENQARSHSPAVREGARVALETVALAMSSSRWLGAERLGHSVALRP